MNKGKIFESLSNKYKIFKLHIYPHKNYFSSQLYTPHQKESRSVYHAHFSL